MFSLEGLFLALGTVLVIGMVLEEIFTSGFWGGE